MTKKQQKLRFGVKKPYVRKSTGFGISYIMEQLKKPDKTTLSEDSHRQSQVSTHSHLEK